MGKVLVYHIPANGLYPGYEKDVLTIPLHPNSKKTAHFKIGKVPE